MENGVIEEKVGKGRRYWRSALVLCSVVIVFILLLLALMLVSLYRSPYYKGVTECRLCIKQVGDALGRYAIKNDRYPDRLTDLVPDYIPTATLHCPMDKSGSESISYIYTKRSIDSPDDSILLTCDRHRLRSVMPGVTIHYLKSGNVTVTPGEATNP